MAIVQNQVAKRATDLKLFFFCIGNVLVVFNHFDTGKPQWQKSGAPRGGEHEPTGKNWINHGHSFGRKHLHLSDDEPSGIREMAGLSLMLRSRSPTYVRATWVES